MYELRDSVDIEEGVVNMNEELDFDTLTLSQAQAKPFTS